MSTLTLARGQPRQRGSVRRFIYQNSLSIALLAIFAASLVGQAITGQLEYNSQQAEHGQETVGFAEYLSTGHFVETVFENWESEFLQMAGYVLLTVWLRQKGSSESKGLEGSESVDADPRERSADPRVPWPVRRGGLVLKLYENSLALAMILLFVLSFALHAVGGAAEYNEEQREHGEPSDLSALEYVAEPRFWFESFQNWQSEFLSLGVMVLLSVYLRQRGSPESKPVAAPHSETGSE